MDQNNKIFIAASLANGASFSMILPLLAPLVRQLKLSELQAGAMVSIGALLMVISALYISKHQTKFSIFQLMSVGFMGMAVTWGMFTGILIYGLSAQISLLTLFTLLMIARATTGIFMAMPTIALQTQVMTAYSHEQQRAQTMSKFGALNSVGVIMGPFLTTLLLAWGMLTPLLGAILILSLVSLVIVFGFKRDEIKPQAQPSNGVQAIEHARSNFSFKTIAAWLLLGFSLYLAIVTVNLTAGFYLQDHFEMSIAQGAVYFAQCSLIVGVSLVTMQMLISKYLDWSLQRLLWVGLLTMSAALLSSVLTTQLIIFQLSYVLYGIAVACLTPAFSTGAAQHVPKPLQAKVASWCTAMQALSFVVGPLLSTALYQYHQAYPYYFLIVLMFGLISYFAFKGLIAAQQNTVVRGDEL